MKAMVVFLSALWANPANIFSVHLTDSTISTKSTKVRLKQVHSSAPRVEPGITRKSAIALIGNRSQASSRSRQKSWPTSLRRPRRVWPSQPFKLALLPAKMLLWRTKPRSPRRREGLPRPSPSLRNLPRCRCSWQSLETST